MSLFRLQMHPASEGDALMVVWGAEEARCHALIDMGRSKNYEGLRPILGEIGRIDLFVVSHIDADHIGGVLPLFKQDPLPFKAAHVWFNAHAQHQEANARLPFDGRVVLGVAQAEKVTAGLASSGWSRNAHFASGIISIDSPEAAGPIGISNGLSVRLLSPSDRKLAQLLPSWSAYLEAERLRTVDEGEPEQEPVEGRVRLGRSHVGPLDVDALATGPYAPDTARPNGGSIAFIAEYAGTRVLLAADAHPETIESSLRGLGASETSPYRIDCLKVSHHGSKANTSSSMLKIIDCTCFAFSTDGSHHGHPDPELIARILKNDPKRPKTLIFNFRQKSALRWQDCDLMRAWNYRCIFPPEDSEGIEIDLKSTDPARMTIGLSSRIV